MKQRDRIEIMFEDMTGKFDAVMEGFAGLNRKLDMHDERFDQVDRRLDNLTAELRRTNDNVLQLNAVNLDHETRITTLEQQPSRLLARES
jgi:chromosome segregation ATPase